MEIAYFCPRPQANSAKNRFIKACRSAVFSEVHKNARDDSKCATEARNTHLSLACKKKFSLPLKSARHEEIVINTSL